VLKVELGKKQPVVRVSVAVIQAVAAMLDVILACLVFIGGTEAYHFTLGIRPPHTNALYLLSITVALVYFAILALQGAYSAASLRLRLGKPRLVFTAWIASVSLSLWLVFFDKTTNDFSRGSFAVILVLGIPIIISGHYFFVTGIGYLMERQRLSLTSVMLVLVGDNIHGASLAVSGRQTNFSFVQQALDELETKSYDAILLSCDWRDSASIQKMSTHLSRIPVPMYLMTSDRHREFAVNPYLNLGQYDAYELNAAPLTQFQQVQKRVLDITISLIALILLSPIFLITSFAIFAESGRPIVFNQYRKGFGGKAFSIFKFRSMSVQENGAVIKQATRGDTRITKVGAFIRRTSIDELPQLLNVLSGKMSLVGPRPHALSHDNHYGQLIEEYAFRHHVKPGITGWAQVNGYRGETKELELMENRVKHDLWYINHWSLFLDFRILILTALQVLLPSEKVY
jgi:exopolysaccharide biosynthesis polyprenyl glycosylphosphotransferase